MPDPPTITINMDESCPTCGKRGAIVKKDGTVGPCLACFTTFVTQRARKKGGDA